jgi:hypothetical protein
MVVAFQRIAASFHRGVLATAGACLAALLSTVPASASTLAHTYRFDSSRATLTPDPLHRAAGSMQLTAGDLPRTWESGAAEIPYDLVTFLVPRGSQLVGLRARALGEHALAEAVQLAAAEAKTNDEGASVAPAATSEWAASIANAAPIAGLESAASLYPPARAVAAGGGALHGYQLLSVRVYPLHYDAAGRRVLVDERIDLELDLAPGGALPLQRERYSAPIEAAARASLARLVCNPEALDGYDRRIGTLVEKGHGASIRAPHRASRVATSTW